ncbi:MAG: RNA-binding protein [Methyloceanibacter sp.]|uniref:RNA-binding protein n=1 Tax=Methyloceanibacter sp. TaxID=1965321 RepID=UPI003D9B9A2A
MTEQAKRPKRPRDVIGNAVRVMEIATGQAQEKFDTRDEGKNQAAAELGRKGGEARAASLSKKRRAEIAKKAAKSRWKNQ